MVMDATVRKWLLSATSLSLCGIDLGMTIVKYVHPYIMNGMSTSVKRTSLSQ
jgi:hypothetical protein